MMANDPVKDDGGSAFPSEQHECADGTWNQTLDPGMSLRDWFAGQALGGMCADGEGLVALGSFARKKGGTVRGFAAKHAYQFADAMLAERRKDVDDGE